jgi:cell division protein FtsB
MLTWGEFVKWVSTMIPIATFAALFVTVTLFVKNKGTIDALKETTATYKSLSESKEAEVKQLEKKQVQLKEEIEALTKECETQRGAVKVAVDELIDGFARVGVKVDPPKLPESK